MKKREYGTAANPAQPGVPANANPRGNTLASAIRGSVMQQQDERTYLPEIFTDFRDEFPEISRAYDELALKCHEWGPLDKKSRRLIKLGIAMGANSEGGVRSHARRALDEGITPEEIRHAVILALTTAGFPTMIASLKWVEEVLNRHTKI